MREPVGEGFVGTAFRFQDGFQGGSVPGLSAAPTGPGPIPARRLIGAVLGLALALTASAALAASKGRDACYDDDATVEETIAGCTQVIGQRKRTSKDDVKIAFHNRAWAYKRQSKYDRAVADLNEAIRIDPDYADAYRLRGSTYDDLAEYDAALADLGRAIRIDPSDANAFVTRGIVYANKDEHARAVQDFDEAVRLNPDRGLTRYSRARSLEKLGDLDRALADAEAAARLDTDDEDIPELLTRLRALHAARAKDKPAAKAPDTAKALDTAKVATKTETGVVATPSAASPPNPASALDPTEARLAAYAWGLLARDVVARCDIATTAKQRAGLEARLASLRPDMAAAEPGLRARFAGRAEGCPPADASAGLADRLTAFADLSPEAFAAEMERRTP